MYRVLVILSVCALLNACSNLPLKKFPKLPRADTDSVPAEPSNESEPSETDSSAASDSDNAPAPRQTAASGQQQSAGERPSEQPHEMPASSQTDESSGSSPQTDAEKVAVLDRRLEAALRHYDKQLHAELEQAEAEKQARAVQRQAVAPALEDVSADESEQSGDSNEHQAPDRQRERPATADSTPAATDVGKQPQGAGSDLPIDVPSGDDDDVIARQLRKAAAQEQDPELREKLWDEYRKYKKQGASTSSSSGVPTGTNR